MDLMGEGWKQSDHWEPSANNCRERKLWFDEVGVVKAVSSDCEDRACKIC